MRILLLCITASILQCITASSAIAQPITSAPLPPLDQLRRLKWATYSTIGPPNLGAGMVTSAWGTWHHSPEEYPPTWEGWAMRQGLRVSGSATSNLMEAEFGALWGEDPRYHRAPTTQFKGRVMHVIKSAVVAYNREGKQMPAYSRYIAIPGSNILANTWRPDSQRTVSDTSARIVIGFASRMGANAFYEFWPEVKKYVFKRK